MTFENIRLKSLTVDDQQLILSFKNNNPRVVINNDEYDSLLDLTKRVQNICTAKFLVEFVEIANFLCHGIQYEIITDPQKFQKSYKKLSDAANYDITVIEIPRIEKQQAIFYVEETQSNIPFEVRCQWPYKEVSYDSIQYKALPYSKK